MVLGGAPRISRARVHHDDSSVSGLTPFTSLLPVVLGDLGGNRTLRISLSSSLRRGSQAQRSPADPQVTSAITFYPRRERRWRARSTPTQTRVRGHT